MTVRGEPYNSGGEIYNSTTLSTGGKELVNDGTLRLNPTGSGEVGGSVVVETGSIHNNGLIDAETETPTRLTQLLESFTNGPSGRLEVNGGVFQGNNGALTTNEGLVTVAPGALMQLEEAASFVNAASGTFSPQLASASDFGAIQLTGPCCNGPGKFTAGGTLAPALIGGFVPAAGQEFDLFALDGGKFEGTFAALANGFTADYSHEASEPAFVGVLYGTSAGRWLGTNAKGSGRPHRLDLPQARQAHRDALLPGRRRRVSGREHSGHRHRASEGWQNHRAHRAQGQEESSGAEEAGRDRDRQRNACGGRLQDARAHTERDRKRAAEEVRQAHGDHDHQLGWYDDQHGDRPLANKAAKGKEKITVT